ncbi:MAG: 50S ribosomal protein L29 [Porticoccaceae bacterium]|jgi:large subunit ribosomal protein L29|nr:50S ribosomal protein L29 [Porticoccaceae bacterium]
MNTNELRAKSVEELEADLLQLRRDQLKYRIQQSTGQLSQPHLIRQARRDVAKIKTLLTQKAGE